MENPMKSTHAVPVSLLNRAVYRLEHPTSVTPSGKIIATAVLNRIRRLKLENQFDLDLFLQELAGMEEIALEDVQTPPRRVHHTEAKLEVIAAALLQTPVKGKDFIPEVRAFLDTGDHEHLLEGDNLKATVLKNAKDYIFVNITALDQATGEVTMEFFSSGKKLTGYLTDELAHSLGLGLAIVHRSPRTSIIDIAQNLTMKQKRLASVFNSLFGAAKKGQ
jgi:AraC-like DNA-binding protein